MVHLALVYESINGKLDSFFVRLEQLLKGISRSPNIHIMAGQLKSRAQRIQSLHHLKTSDWWHTRQPESHATLASRAFKRFLKLLRSLRTHIGAVGPTTYCFCVGILQLRNDI